jgi:hypothetical protein
MAVITKKTSHDFAANLGGLPSSLVELAVQDAQNM